MKNKKFSVIIIDYKSIKRTLVYIDEFCKYCNEYHDINFIIVDNFEKRNGKEIMEYYNVCNKIVFQLKNNKFIDVYYRTSDISLYILHVRENVGYAKGNNLGAIFAKEFLNSNYVIFSNNDIKFLQNFTLNTFENDFLKKKSIFAVGPTVIGIDGVLQSPARLLGFWDGIIVPYSFFKLFNRFYKKNRYNDFFLSGCFFVVDLEKFFDIGMFDENTFLYWEEAILKERGRQFQYRLYYDSGIKIIHEGGGVTLANNSSLQLVILYFESAYYYFKVYKNINRVALYIARINFYMVYVPLCKIRNALKRLIL